MELNRSLCSHGGPLRRGKKYRWFQMVPDGSRWFQELCRGCNRQGELKEVRLGHLFVSREIAGNLGDLFYKMSLSPLH